MPAEEIVSYTIMQISSAAAKLPTPPLLIKKRLCRFDDAAFLEKESRGLVFGAVNSVTEGTRNSPEHQYGRSTDQNINDPA